MAEVKKKYNASKEHIMEMQLSRLRRASIATRPQNCCSLRVHRLSDVSITVPMLPHLPNAILFRQKGRQSVSFSALL